jgi:hypothetical protein
MLDRRDHQVTLGGEVVEDPTGAGRQSRRQFDVGDRRGLEAVDGEQRDRCLEDPFPGCLGRADDAKYSLKKRKLQPRSSRSPSRMLKA